MRNTLNILSLLVILGLLHGCDNNSGNNHPSPPDNPPNILFFILDDVGIDQMQSFGYGGASPPQTPNSAPHNFTPTYPQVCIVKPPPNAVWYIPAKPTRWKSSLVKSYSPVASPNPPRDSPRPM